MPTTPFKNLIYAACLPLLAPSPRGQMTHAVHGQIHTMSRYEAILAKHHVFGSTLLLKDGQRQVIVHTSTKNPAHRADNNTLYRVASITKTATTLVALKLCDEGILSLDVPIAQYLPDAAPEACLTGVTVRHLLCHKSGLRDTPAYQAALDREDIWAQVLKNPNASASRPGEVFSYSNFGFGLLGCVLESASGQTVSDLFQEKLFSPLGMRATLDASTLNEADIMPITRVLPYHSGTDVTITRLGRRTLSTADPLRHFGHTAGAMYTDAPSLSRMLTLIAQDGVYDSQPIISSNMIREMKTLHGFSGPAANPERRYGLGLVLLENSAISPHQLLGHQGFAYGCVDGAFVEENTGRQVVFLNGGSSECRQGRLGLVNRDILRWALKEEMPSWT